MSFPFPFNDPNLEYVIIHRPIRCERTFESLALSSRYCVCAENDCFRSGDSSASPSNFVALLNESLMIKISKIPLDESE